MSDMDLSQADALHLLKALHAEQRYRQVQTLAQAFLRSFPTHTEVLELLSDALLLSGAYEQALTVLARALALEPELPEHHLRKGTCLLALQQTAAAQLCFEQALHLCVDHAASRTQLARCLFLQGQLDAAIEHCSKVLALEPQHVAAQQLLGKCLTQLGMLQEAAGHFQICVELCPTDVQSRTGLAAVLMALGQHEQALQHYRSALLCDATNLSALRSLAEALLLLERYAEADPLLERLLLLQAEDPTLHLLAGQSQERQGNSGRALSFYTEAAQSETCAREPFYLMMLSLRKLGRYQDALRCCQQVVATDEHYQGIVLHQAQLLAINGDTAAAWTSFAHYGEQLLSGSTAQPGLLQAADLSRLDAAAPARLLLHNCGNYSDDLYFLQWLPTLLQTQKLKVVLVCGPLLSTLVTTLYGIATVSTAEASLTCCDYQLSLFALPWLCQQAGLQKQDAVPDPLCIQALQEESFALAENTAAARIGIAWKGASPFPGAGVPALPPDLPGTLQAVSSAGFFALQWGAEELVQDASQCLDLVTAADCSDYRAIAARLCQMDLVITCDCALAQLAALFGRPLLLLHDPAAAGWVWSREFLLRLQGEAGSYPAATLIAKQEPDAAGRIVARVRALSALPVAAPGYQEPVPCR